MTLRLPAHIHDIAFHRISVLQTRVFFIQIGAADGRRFDPVYPFVKRYHWHGILVEPLGDIFALLKANYQDEPGLQFENVAITERDETRRISRIPLEQVGEGGIPGWALGASTLLPEKTRFSSSNSPAPLHSALNAAVVQEEVTCISLATLLRKHAVDRIDVLQLDTEGYDAKIISQLDFSRFKPSLINMEWQWLADAEKREVAELLRAHGYFLYQAQADLLAAARPIESMVITPTKLASRDIPRFFPGVIGLKSHAPIVESGGTRSVGQARYEVVRYRGTSSPISGNGEVYRILTLVDGRNTYGDIAHALGRDGDDILKWANELRLAYIIE